MKSHFLIPLLLIGIIACNQKKTTNKILLATPEEQPISAFPYLPPSPQNGTLKGIIELGGSGFNAFIVEIDAKKRWKLQSADFGKSEVYEDKADGKKIRSGLETFIQKLRKDGVANKDIHFIQSSTATGNERVQQINGILNQMGYQINSVTTDQEAKYGYLATMPNEFADESFYVDMGSGNTKIAWKENGEIKTISTYGSKYYVDEVSHEIVYAEVKALLAQIPTKNLERCFIIGGGPYMMAEKNKEFTERYGILKSPDAYDFDSEKLKCALNIYKAMLDGSDQKTDYLFDWEGNFSIGFLLQL